MTNKKMTLFDGMMTQKSMLSIILVVCFKSCFVFGEMNHVPQFFQALEVTRITEGQPVGTHVMKAKATDADGDSILYSIRDDKDHYFTVDKRTGDVRTAKEIDKEIVSTIEFKIVASELKSPDQNSFQKVLVHVSDVNDNKPIFEHKNYYANISESSKPETFVKLVRATDLDHPPELIYRIVAGNEDEFFKIEDYEGKIRTAKRLDYEKRSHFNLVVQASDSRPNDPDRLSSLANVYINIKDEDDNGARFTGNYSTTLIEGYHKGKAIQKVHAVDGDKGIRAPVKYSIDPTTNIENLFSIDPRTGTVYVNGNVDREKKPFYNLRLLAEDTSSSFSFIKHPPGYASLKIVIVDVNDNSPEFSQLQYFGKVTEHVKKGTHVLFVHAKDKDKGKNAMFEYLLDDPDKAFGISQTGGIFVMKDLDRETKYDYQLKVIARQAGRSDSTALVYIMVQDKNDHAPIFSKSLYKQTLSENLAPGAYVTQVSATDNDKDRNAEITYRILPDAEGSTSCFTVHPGTGVIKALCPLDHELKSSYLLLVEASDNAALGERKNARCTVKISVKDENDNKPIFKKLEYPKKVNYDEEINTPIVKVEATDKDTGPYADISYRIVRGNSDGRFHIDSKTGQVKIGDALPAYSGRLIELFIQAYDNNGLIPSNNSPQLAIVKVTIQKKGENSVVLSMKKEVGEVKRNIENIASDLKKLLRIGIEVDKVDVSGVGLLSTNFMFHGYDENTQAVVKKKQILSVLASSRKSVMRFRKKWNITSFHEEPVAPENKAVADANSKEKGDAKWHPIIFAVLGFSALIAIFGAIGIIYLIKTKRRNDDDGAASLTSSRIPIAARKQAHDLWSDENLESVSQVGRTESYVRSCDRYELDPSNLYSTQDAYRDDPFSTVNEHSPSNSSNGSRASSIFAASSVMTVMTAYNSKNPAKSAHSKRFHSPRDRKLSIIVDDDGSTKRMLEDDDSHINSMRPPSYEYDLDEKFAEKYDYDV